MNRLISYCLALAAIGTSGLAVAGGDVAAGQQKSATCTACHGPDGNSSDPQFPRLAGQHADYLERALMDYQSGARKNAIMSGFAAGLSKQDMADLAAYYAQQTGLHSTAQGRAVSR